MQGSSELQGVAPRAVDQLFEGLRAKLTIDSDEENVEDLIVSDDEESKDAAAQQHDEQMQVDENENQELVRQDTSMDSIRSQTSVFVSVSQIYNEVISDLLSPG